MGASLCEAALIGLWQPSEQDMAEDELEHRIAEEFEALIVHAGPLALVTDATMRECLCEQAGLAEDVAEDAVRRGVHARGEAYLLAWAMRRVPEKNGVTDGIRTRNNQNHNLGLYL